MVELATCLLLPSCPWHCPGWRRLAWFTGNPVYPFFYDVSAVPIGARPAGGSLPTGKRPWAWGARPWTTSSCPCGLILSAERADAHFDGSLNRMWIALVRSRLLQHWNRTVRAVWWCPGSISCAGRVRASNCDSHPIIPVLAIAAALAWGGGELMDRRLRGRLSWWAHLRLSIV